MLLSEPLRCACGAVARYTRGEGRRRVGFCQQHAPLEVLHFQALALAVMQRGANRAALRRRGAP